MLNEYAEQGPLAQPCGRPLDSYTGPTEDQNLSHRGSLEGHLLPSEIEMDLKEGGALEHQNTNTPCTCASVVFLTMLSTEEIT